MTRTRHEVEDLIAFTGVSPQEALAAARALLVTGPGPREASIAHQAALRSGQPRLLLGSARRDQLGDGPVIIVPPGRLNAVPWGLLPSLAGRAVSVAPSARAWCRASTAGPFGLDKTVLVSGPGLGAASTEVRTLAGQYGQATVLVGGSATTARVLAAIDGAGLAASVAQVSDRAAAPLMLALHRRLRSAGPGAGARAAALRDAAPTPAAPPPATR